MNIKKLILAVVLVSLFNVLFGAITCGGAFSWIYKLEPTNVWKSMDNFSFPLMILSDVFINFIFVLVYAIIKSGVPGKNKVAKGLLFGLLVWLVGMLPGMIMTYLYQSIATTVVIYWAIWGLIVSPVKGLIAAAVYGE